jgi:hypothetical protein
MVFLFLALLHQNSCYPNNKNIRTICPRLYERTFKGFVPKGNLTAGTVPHTAIKPILLTFHFRNLQRDRRCL